jgi:hypothetical protein
MRLEVEDIKIANGRGFYYLATPYSKWKAGLDDAAKQAALLAGALIKRGIGVYSPIAHSHTIAVAADIDPFSHEIWLPADKPLADAAFGLIVAGLDGWRESYGIGKEIEWFGLARKPRYLLDPSSLTLQVLP